MINDLKSINDIAQFLKGQGERLQPMKAFQIEYLQTKLNCILPQEYKTFLSLMGNGSGRYMEGSSAFSEELLHLKEWTNELLAENSMQPLPNSAFVFWMHQGYQAAYFNLNEGDDPPVYYFSEGFEKKEFILKEKRLTDFFIAQLKMDFGGRHGSVIK